MGVKRTRKVFFGKHLLPEPDDKSLCRKMCDMKENQPDTDDELTMAQAVEICKCSPQNINAAVSKGRIKFRWKGSQRLFQRDSVLAWNKKRPKLRGRPPKPKPGFIRLVGTAGAGPGQDDPADGDETVSLTDLFGDKCVMVRVRGNSMRDRHITDGDFVVVQQHPSAVVGDTVMAQVNEKHVIKRLIAYNSGTGRADMTPTVALVPCDGPSKGKEIPVNDDVTVLGVVVGVVRKC